MAESAAAQRHHAAATVQRRSITPTTAADSSMAVNRKPCSIANAPAIHGTGEIKLETDDRAAGYWITRSEADPTLNARTSGVYLRADASDLAVLDGRDNDARAALIAERIQDWKSIANS